MATLGVPKAVSPLIRFSRYTALFTGIIYGAARLKYLNSKEAKIQQRESVIKEKRAVRLAKEKEESARLEMEALGREAGVLK